MKVEKKTIVTVVMSDRQWRAFQFVASVVADATHPDFQKLYDVTDVGCASFGFTKLEDAHRAIDELLYEDEPQDT